MTDKIVGMQTAMFDVKPTYAWHGKKKDHINQKHAAIKKRFTELYDGKRIRYDDAIEMLCKEFFLAKITIERIIRK